MEVTQHDVFDDFNPLFSMPCHFQNEHIETSCYSEKTNKENRHRFKDLPGGLGQYKHHAVHNNKHLFVLAIRSEYIWFQLHS